MREKAKKRLRYEFLVEEMKLKILKKIYKPGEKLPSIREMHKQINMSITTVSKAYEVLELSGLVEARDRSGYYVKTATLKKLQYPEKSKLSLVPKLVNRSEIVDEVLNSMDDETKVPLGAAFISSELLPYKHYSKILKNLTKKEIMRSISYNQSQGLPELRRLISLRTLGLLKNTNPEDIIITNGCTEALALSLKAIVKPGDTIAIEAPAYYGIHPVFQDLNLFVIEIPTDPETGIDYNGLQKVTGTKEIKCCILNSNFHNPLGCMIPDSKKEKIVTLLNEHEIPIIEDDIYSDLYFEKQHPKPLKSFDKKGLVITCSSFSKTLAPGFRVGWVIAEEPFKKKIITLKSGISISTSTLDQYILFKFLESGFYEKHLRTLRNTLRNHMNKTIKAIYEYFPKNIRMHTPKGGFLLWIQLPKGVSSIELYKKSLSKNIAILPGSICSSSDNFKEYIRISCGSPFTDEIENAIKTIGILIKELMK